MRGIGFVVALLAALAATAVAAASSGPTLDKADISAAACKTGHARQLVTSGQITAVP